MAQLRHHRRIYHQITDVLLMSPFADSSTKSLNILRIEHSTSFEGPYMLDDIYKDSDDIGSIAALYMMRKCVGGNILAAPEDWDHPFGRAFADSASGLNKRDWCFGASAKCFAPLIDFLAQGIRPTIDPDTIPLDPHDVTSIEQLLNHHDAHYITNAFASIYGDGYFRIVEYTAPPGTWTLNPVDGQVAFQHAHAHMSRVVYAHPNHAPSAIAA